MDQTLIQTFANYGAMGIMLVWFMVKNSKDLDNIRQIIEQQNQLTRDTLNEVKNAIINVMGNKGTTQP
jgi:hypothetical protein